jgi:LysM repeat protein
MAGTVVALASVTPTPYFYQVQFGDTLWQIAQRHGIDLATLIRVNELEDPNVLYPGQRLLISRHVTISGTPLPTATPTLYFYRVQPGDTLWRIAQRHGLDVETLRQVNGLQNPHVILAGQRLLISDRVTLSGTPLPTRTPTATPP